MIRCILFSKDRAMQLHAVLRSLFSHCADIDILHISVLYTCSSEQHNKQYMQLKKEWEKHHNVDFIPQKQFRKDIFKILNPYQPKSIPYRFVEFLSLLHHRLAYILTLILPVIDAHEIILFLVDDNMFVRDFRMEHIQEALWANPESLGFSLRLGRNTTYCYMDNVDQKPPDFIPLDDGVLKFTWINAEKDFGYPLEVSSSVYRTSELLPFLLGIRFNNPNHLEGGMNRLKDAFKAHRPAMLCFENSVAFCNPINLVQNISPTNRVGKHRFYSTTELANLFDQGNQIQIEAYNGRTTISCHQEVDLIFEKTRTIQ